MAKFPVDSLFGRELTPETGLPLTPSTASVPPEEHPHIMIFYRRILASLVCAAPLLLVGCSLPRFSMPHTMGMGSYYAVTDEAAGRVYYTDNLSREPRGVVEFRDSASDAWVSLPAATVREISEAEFKAGPPKVITRPVSDGAP
jgi:hypothetical protein